MTAVKIDPQILLQKLGTAVIGRDLRCFDSIGSTNQFARQYAEKGAPDGTVIIAEHQSDGRGRLNRAWLAPPHTSILCSIIFYPAIKPEYLFRLTMLASIAVVDALRASTGIEAGIKWPNDIYAARKKLCGILTEVDCSGSALNYAVVGIGLNVNWSLKGTELEKQATSVQDIIGYESSRQEILLKLLQHLDALYARLADRTLQEQWQQRCMHLGKRVQVLSGRNCLEGIARGITDQGHLLLENACGMQEILCGDVSLRW
jgi:BirA family transcriptional regulator, biotin operon repressor / biotin---[acetyl-CoA-carboxylase] ligase